jgi:hypothetical protein
MPQNKNLTHIHSSGGGIGETDEVNFATKTGIDRKTGPPLPAGRPEHENEDFGRVYGGCRI